MTVQTSYVGLWEVGGIKIERTRARNICFRWDTEIGEKSDFFGKMLRTRKFSTEPTESLRTQDSENIVGLGDRASVSKL